ncbi:probable inactive receptor kinase At4g23740 [Coffea arabica]|uniref:Probable inactive receptor kinase At4g23740 n=1 Tax=Coffea arabica TaxID=13443 RepID=A0A6P6VKU4_COFAR|nr:probable inactive receptor kinase At4g23740 [Coffea arabica]XP_027103623.1 probable inactive receptor kinase At4g23740 [Coffea arabica]XP_027103624.1 probable inactive receptor kinase At4g23740 [Coffea arabica]
MGIKFIFLAIFLSGALVLLARSEPSEDKQALLDFANNMYHSRPLNWDVRTSACNLWTGVTCNHDKSRIIAVRLPGFGFRGSVPSNTLARLSALQILSLRSNGFSGPFPSDLSKLGNLTSLYLQLNKFQGPLPQNFSVWENLSVINLSDNAFNGSIPASISNLTHLTALNLSNNSFSGEIPDLNVPSLQLLDLSNNNLTGNVPQSLTRFPNSAFSGNQLAPEVSSPPVVPPNEKPEKKSSRISEPAVLGIIIGGSSLGFVLIAVLLIICYSNKEAQPKAPKKPKKEVSLKREKKTISASQDGDGRLVFFENCNLAFDLEDLLRASAEVLGKGSFGTTYKAALEDGTTVAVKRLKEVSVGKREFELQMEAVGNVRHENVAQLRAYYYSKDEKLMVYDYYAQGSVSALLHAKMGEKRIPLDWESRVRIATGAARGITHIHSECGGKLVHGNMKASNIFLNSQQYGCVSDLGLATLITPIAPPVMRTAGYRAPEVTDSRKVSQASDVYSFGVLLLELLTGKSPIHATGGDEVIHLVRWVNSVVREEWTAEVFDVELLRFPNIEEEMVEMLRIGMTCVARMPEQRPKMSDVLKMVEDMRRVNTGNPPSTETRTEESTPAALTPIAADIASTSGQQ